MKRSLALIVCLLCIAVAVRSQTSAVLHIVTVKGNLQWPLKFRFEVNGVAYSLSHGECMDITLEADSVFVDVQDSRTFKYETYDLKTAASPDMNIWIYFGKNEGSSIKHFYVNKDCECFAEIQKGCVKTVRVVQGSPAIKGL